MTREEAKKLLNKLYARADITDEYGDMEDMQKYEEAVNMAIKALEQEPCWDAISRSDAIRIASGYCHWTNIPKELAKLPSVNPIPCEDAISRQTVLEGLASIAKAKARSDAQKSMMGRTMFFVERLPSVNPQASKEDIHREREQAYMKCYEDASKKYRTEPCDEAISRKAVLDLLQKEREEVSITSESIAKVRIAEINVEDLKAIPFVSVTEKTGRWYAWKPEDDVWRTTCSECGEETRTLWNYCPNCGCRMIETQESDNRRCGNCKYFGGLLNKNDTPHSCNNNKSRFKACMETATGCEKFEPQESEDKG